MLIYAQQASHVLQQPIAFRLRGQIQQPKSVCSQASACSKLRLVRQSASRRLQGSCLKRHDFWICFLIIN